MSQDIPRDASHGSAFDAVAKSDDAQRGNVVSLPTTAELDSHPVAALFPLMDVASPEFEDLVADVREHGLRESIRLYEGKILDGRNRYRACRHAGVEPRFEEWSGDSPVLHVLTANFRQRSLTDDQKAMFFVCAWEKYQEEVSLPVGYKRPHWHNVMLSAASRMATLQHGAEHVERTVRNRAAAGDSEAMCIIRQIERRAWRELCDFSRGGLSSPWIEFGFSALPARRHDLPEIPDPFGAIRGPL